MYVTIYLTMPTFYTRPGFTGHLAYLLLSVITSNRCLLLPDTWERVEFWRDSTWSWQICKGQ